MDALSNLAAVRIVWEQRAMWVVRAREQEKTWDQIAEAVGLSRQTVINLYNGETSRISTAEGVGSAS